MIGFRRPSAAPAPPELRLPEASPLRLSLARALRERQTRREFSDAPISDEDLAAILWAADGVNRRDGRRTTPSAMNWQEVDVYVVKANGVWRWAPARRALTFIAERDRRAALCRFQPLTRHAPAHLVFVSVAERTNTLVTSLAREVVSRVARPTLASQTEAIMDRARMIDVGVKVQAAALACAALGVNCLPRMTFGQEAARQVLELPSEHEPIFLLTIGYPPKPLLRRRPRVSPDGGSPAPRD